MKVCVPTNPAVATFLSIVDPLFDRIAANEHKSAALPEIRDTLLPRLISDKLRLPEAKRPVEATA
ncbi:MAG: hypothetical protein ACREPL_04285 [Rhodanobacteraceae bacterium]